MQSWQFPGMHPSVPRPYSTPAAPQQHAMQAQQTPGPQPTAAPVAAGPSAAPAPAPEPDPFSPEARAIVEEYKRDLMESIIEEASKVARHRGASEISERDLALVLAKQFGLEVNIGMAAPLASHDLMRRGTTQPPQLPQQPPQHGRKR